MTSNSLIIKLVDKRHLHQFLKVGELHFGTTVQYQEIENSGKNCGIGDRLEGDYDPIIKTTGILKRTVKFPKKLHFFRPANIFCTTQLRPGIETNEFIKPEVIKGLYESLMSDTNYPKQIVLFKDYNVIHSKIVNKLQTIFSESGSEHMEGPVIYSDMRAIDAELLGQKLNPREPRMKSAVSTINLVKDRKFEIEKEYRYVLFPSEGMKKRLQKHHNNMYIGNLEDQAVLINSVDELQSSIQITFEYQ